MTPIGAVILCYLVLIVATLITVNYVLREKKREDDKEWHDGTKGE